MITHVSIKNFAIIKDLSLDLYPGLNIITGETGAGKSVIIEAISMALGSRADTDFIRSGEDKATITLLADTDAKEIPAMLKELDIPADMPLILYREIGSQRSICRINGVIVPLSFLGKICRHIADIHGQYDHQALLNTESHIDVLDLYGGKEIEETREKTSAYYEAYLSASTELSKLRRRLADSSRQKELFAYELSEIDSVSLHPGEDETLDQEIAVMQHSEQIYSSLSKAYEYIFGDEGANQTLGNAMSLLQEVAGYSREIDSASEVVANAYYSVDELSHDLRHLRDSISFSQEELDAKIERRETIETLKRKYGGSVESVLAYRDKAAEALKIIENSDADQNRLEGEIAKAKAQYLEQSGKLTLLRKAAAKLLENKVTKELGELAFNDTYLKVSIAPAAPSPSGSDAVEFLIATNRGAEPRPLAKIASGGELSRVMLALKRIIGDLDQVPTMIFDEIDTGISGATAGVVGDKLEQIAENHQIVCITHLPQIACKGMHHFRIAKYSDEISTQTTVVPLEPKERIEELARILSGTTVTEAARIQAKELLGY